jgi:hypothetical protein
VGEPEKSQQPEIGSGTGTEMSGLTRREWILRLGEAAILAGFSGAAAEANAGPELQLTSEGIASTALPPGLYDASPEHMAHVLFRDARFITPPPGSETEYAMPHAGTFQPAFFSADEFKVARRLVEFMLNFHGDAANLPPVDGETLDEVAEWIDLVLSQAAATREAARNLSKQHRELAMHYYGEEAVRRLETADPDAAWRQGLTWLDQESHKLGGQGFLNLSEAQQLQLLTSISDTASRIGGQGGNQASESPGGRFYRVLKTETIRSYYTSRAGLKELDYQGNAFHPESPGCPKS